jgi:hypothetical protein
MSPGEGLHMDETRAQVDRVADAGCPPRQIEERIDSLPVTDHAYEDLVRSGPLLAESDAGFAAYDSATIKRVVLYLRAVAAELDQVHPETDTPSERRERTSGCLRKLRESEWMLENLANRP